MPSFLDKAKNNQEEGREKDPAAPSGAPEPDWDNPDSWSGDGGTENNSASGNAVNPADADGDQEHGADGGRARQSAKPKAPRHPPRRRGRPRGPEREMLSVRILASNNRKLTVAVEKTDLNPQTLVDQALEALFKRLKVEDPGPDQVEGAA
ncbi:hypothetical protein OG413_46650 [Streptomyces sp. NBC_01433]|uniref:hypothetical protein n=1 Tax=Streptomyces sp. NBC_01433 TaxID=2903864 RepID=UPI002256749E|nr:hypothetical protein [Streptomyces sp. NBC_01433]MCX4682629.1 hypothetical protein [Streptomyces sp. NBC_01433]MCX4682669.1 hypothetical protein [Streptomyces sp. NBC_01433]